MTKGLTTVETAVWDFKRLCVLMPAEHAGSVRHAKCWIIFDGWLSPCLIFDWDVCTWCRSGKAAMMFGARAPVPWAYCRELGGAGKCYPWECEPPFLGNHRWKGNACYLPGNQSRDLWDDSLFCPASLSVRREMYDMQRFLSSLGCELVHKQQEGKFKLPAQRP